MQEINYNFLFEIFDLYCISAMKISTTCQTNLIIVWMVITVVLFILSVVLFVLKEEGDNSSYIFITAFVSFGVSVVSLVILSFYMVSKGRGVENLKKNGCCFLNDNGNEGNEGTERMEETDGLIDTNIQ